MNKPFDQRVINELERPTSSDLNIAQSQLNLGIRAMARQLLMSNPAFTATGSVGESFFVEKAAGAREVLINRGIGFNYAADNSGTDLNIDGITGLSDPFDYRMVSLQSEAGVIVDVEPGPGEGLCRRDVIAIRCTNPSTNQLEDYTDTDIYDPYYNKFNAVSKPKTFSYDLTGSVPQVLDYTQVGSATGAVVYVTGQNSPYSGPDSLLDAPAPLVSPGYINIAIINVVQSLPTIAASDIVDFRRLVAPQGNLVVKGSATIGSTGLSPGTLLSNVSLKAPPGIKAQLVKYGNGNANSYLLYVYGPRNVTSASIAYSCGSDATAYADLASGISGWKINPTQIVQGPISINQGVTEAVKTLAASSAATPTQQVAVGQPYHIFPFTLCRVDNITTTETSPVSGSIAINPLIIPESASNAWPAGTYSTTITPSTRTYYLQYPTAGASPVTGIPGVVYALKTTSPLSTVNTFTSGNNGNVYTRVAGFVADSAGDWQTFPAGVWRFSARIKVESPVSNPVVFLKAAIYSYDGVNNPEASPALGEVSDIRLTANYLTPNLCDERIEFYVYVPATTVAAGSRLYLALSTRWYYGSGGVSDVVTMYHNGDDPFILESSVPVSTVVSTTIPTLADRYPSDTYPLSGSFTADPISVNAAGEDQILNPSATRFAQKTGEPNVRSVPITFTLNLTVE